MSIFLVPYLTFSITQHFTQRILFLRLFSKLGGLFTFVVHDVNEKTQILSQHLKSSPTNENYVKIEKMLDYETDNGLLLDPNKQNSNNLANGSRTLLRLHRALLFVTKFTENIIKSEENIQMAPLARNAYDETIARFHPWLIKKAVHLALYTLPNRKQVSLAMWYIKRYWKTFLFLACRWTFWNKIFSRRSKYYHRTNVENLSISLRRRSKAVFR